MGDYLSMTQKLTTAVDEFDYREQLKPSAVLQYFQDIATAHAVRLGIGFETMKEQNLCWVLNRISVVVDKPPVLGEIIRVTTYPKKPHLVDAVRDYYVTDRLGNPLIRGTSKWCVLDFRNRAIRRCAPLFRFDDERYMPDDALENGNPQLPALSSVGETEPARKEFCVRITDLDRNGHMNNARYGDVILNCFDTDFLNSHRIRAFDVNFMSELQLGDRYVVGRKEIGENSYLEANPTDSDKTAFRARIEWNAL